MPKYEVTFKFDSGIPVRDLIDEYSSLGVKMKYEDNKLTSIIHTYDYPANLSNEERLRHSTRRLSLFLELLEYRYGLPIKTSSSSKQLDGNSVASTGTVSILLSGAVATEVILPNENIFSNSPLRLTVWLRFLNDARNSPSDAEAIHLYYAVYEDKYGRPNDTHPLEAKHLMYTRDFVSHGEPIDNPDVLWFLSSEIGRGTNQYNPLKSAHRDFVTRQRNQARSFMEEKVKHVLASLAS